MTPRATLYVALLTLLCFAPFARGQERVPMAPTTSSVTIRPGDAEWDAKPEVDPVWKEREADLLARIHGLEEELATVVEHRDAFKSEYYRLSDAEEAEEYAKAVTVCVVGGASILFVLYLFGSSAWERYTRPAAILLALCLSGSAYGQGYYCPPGQPCQPCQPQYRPQYQPQQPQRPQGTQWSDRASDVVVHSHPPNSNQYDVGSGTVIHSEGGKSWVITNNHVIRDGKRFDIRTQNGTYSAELVATDPTNDLAVLRTDFALPAVQVGEVVPGQVTLRSYDFGRLFQVRTARVVGQTARGNGGQSTICGTIVQGGSSGGGCYDQQGRLVGVVWGCRPKDGHTYFVPIGPVRAILLRVGLLGTRPHQQAPQQPQQAPPREVVALPQETWNQIDARIDAKINNLQINGTIEDAQALVARMDALEGQVATLAAACAEPGPAGPRGPKGEPGKDADVGPLVDRIAALEAELAQLKGAKFKVYTHTPQGVFDSEEIPLGGDIHLQYVEARKGDAAK